MSQSREPRELKAKAIILSGSTSSSCCTLFRGYIVSGSGSRLKVTAPDKTVTEYDGTSFIIADDPEVEGKVNITIKR